MTTGNLNKNHQSVGPLEGKKEHLTTADLQAVLEVASPATANSWADAYSRMAERPVRRNARGVRVFEAWQIVEISEAYCLLATRVVSTRTEALTWVLAERSKATANNRLTAGELEQFSRTDEAASDSTTKIIRQIESHEISPDLEPTVVLMPIAATNSSQKTLTIKARWEPLKTRVARAKVFRWILQCFSFGHSPHWQRLTDAQRDAWIRRIGRFNNVMLAFGTIALIAFGIINVVLWGLGFFVQVAAIPYAHVIWTIIICALVIPTVVFFAFPQD